MAKSIRKNFPWLSSPTQPPLYSAYVTYPKTVMVELANTCLTDLAVPGSVPLGAFAFVAVMSLRSPVPPMLLFLGRPTLQQRILF